VLLTYEGTHEKIALKALMPSGKLSRAEG